MEVDKQRIAELVKKIQDGDNSAFDELYKLTSQRAYFIALEFTKNNQDAEDILQESYIKALSKLNELDKPESFSGWLNQIVANKSKDFLKKKKPMLFEAEENEVFEVIPDEDTNFSPEKNLDQNELQKTVMEVLDELSEEKRACILMMYYEELSVGEIAKTLEIPEGTVKTRLFSARKDLKDKFAKRGITSAFSIAPMGVIVWAFRFMSDAASESFIGSGASANVLAKISVAQAGTAASAAAASTASAATSAAVGTSSAVSAGTGIAAKIAALTVAQKVVAGVSVAAVVAGSTVGVVTVVNDNGNKDGISTTAYTEEYTTAPSFETTIAIEALGSVEFSETSEFSEYITSEDNSVTEHSETKKPTSSSNASKTNTTSPKKTTVVNKSTTKKTKTTKAQTTVETRKTTTQKATSTKEETSAKMTETEKETTKKSTTTKKVTTTKKETTTKKITTTKETTTEKQTTTTVAATTKPTTTVKPSVYTTTGVVAILKISIINQDNSVETTLEYGIPAGTELTAEHIYSLCEEKGYYPDFGIEGDDVGKIAQAGETYTVDAKL